MGITEIHQPDEELELTEEQIVGDDDQPKAEDGDDTQAAAEPIDEIEYPEGFDDEEEIKNPHLVATLRDQLRNEQRRRIEAEKRLSAPRIERTPKPTLEGCDYDDSAYEAALLAWHDNERKATEQETQIAEQPNVVQADFSAAIQSYQTGAQKLGKPDFQESQKVIMETLTPDQQSAILMGVKDPARFLYALAKSPVRLAQLAAIQNPFKLAAEAARIEGSRTMPRKEPANIDTPLKGSARLSVETEDKKEAALLEKAQRTGSIDEYRAYMREKRSKAA